MKNEKYDKKRGRHKKSASRETRYWNEHYLPALPEEPEPEPVSLPPPPPAWMDPETARRLYELRKEIA